MCNIITNNYSMQFFDFLNDETNLLYNYYKLLLLFILFII